MAVAAVVAAIGSMPASAHHSTNNAEECLATGLPGAAGCTDRVSYKSCSGISGIAPACFSSFPTVTVKSIGCGWPSGTNGRIEGHTGNTDGADTYIKWSCYVVQSGSFSEPVIKETDLGVRSANSIAGTMTGILNFEVWIGTT